MPDSSTIVATATVPGQSAIAVLRLSGSLAFTIADQLIPAKKMSLQRSHTLHLVRIMDEIDVLDEALVSVFRAPHSYTGEDCIEISCHGSPYIVQRIIMLCITHGAVMAQPGEFTRRAFLNGKLDLSQAEAVADLIASEHAGQHRIAMQQMRGGYSDQIKALRQELIDFAALMELELDFSEEDVEFADREKFLSLLDKALHVLNDLIASFRVGNVLRRGIPVAIVGKPNVGKSTLLNCLLKEEKAIVSDIAGTTRDFIEDCIILNGISFRFIDTAGIRETTDHLEAKGIERSFEKIRQADIILYLADIRDSIADIVESVKNVPIEHGQQMLIVLNKADQLSSSAEAIVIQENVSAQTTFPSVVISAGKKLFLDVLLSQLQTMTEMNLSHHDHIVSNTRHLASFTNAAKSLQLVKQGLQNHLSGEFISIDLRAALHALSEVTGQISSEDILGAVFSRFCIGK